MISIYLECIEHENNHYKDYDITIEGNKVKCVWGRIDATHQGQEYDFSTDEKALKFFKKKVKEKLRKGYKTDLDIILPILKLITDKEKSYFQEIIDFKNQLDIEAQI